MMFPIACCRAGLFTRAYIHLAYWLSRRLGYGRLLLAILPWAGCLITADQRKVCGVSGCDHCDPSPAERQ